MKTKLMKLILLSSACAFFAFRLSAELEPGQIAPELKVGSWLKNGPIKIQQPKDIQIELIYVIEFWGTWSAESAEFIPHLNYLQKKYRDKGLIIVGISREKEKVVSDFLKKRKDIDYSIGVDYMGQTSSAYLELDPLPRIFIVKGEDRKVLWEGEIVDLEQTLEKIFNGEFELEKQKEISALRKNMELALRSNSDKVVEGISDKILDIDPRNSFAIRGRLFIYERSNHLDDALSFINKMIKKDPDSDKLYFIKMGLMERTNQPAKKIHAFLFKFQKHFIDQPEVMNNLAMAVMENMPFGYAYLDIALSAAQKAVEGISGKNTYETKAAYHATLARAYYSIGLLEKALNEQQKACDFLKGLDGEKNARRILEYYVKAIELKMLNGKNQD